jgi:hypothetical protein
MWGCVLFLDALEIPLSVVFLMVEEGSVGLTLPCVIQKQVHRENY